MKKIYIARRIPKKSNTKYILEINPYMTDTEIHKAYVREVKQEKKFIYNGPWILRPPINDNEFAENCIPNSITPTHIWNMVKGKIESSDILLGIIDSKAYGTIAEIGFASKCNMAVYVLPGKNIPFNEVQDLWLVFQIAKTTQDFWCDEDFKLLKEFRNFGISSVSDYRSYLDSIIPKFME